MEPATQEPKFDLIELVRCSQKGLWRYLRFLGCDAELAEDLAQETFLAVHRQPFRAASGGAAAAYLRRVAFRLLLKHRRKLANHPKLVELEQAEQVWQAHVKRGEDAYRDALRHCLTLARERSRRALQLFYGCQMSRRQVAAELGLEDEGVKTLLRRSRQDLRDCVKRKVGA